LRHLWKSTLASGVLAVIVGVLVLEWQGAAFISGAASLILAVLAFRHFGDAVLLLAIWMGWAETRNRPQRC
jgi:uncharacterized membrane protein HdeD (DUF308 family)